MPGPKTTDALTILVADDHADSRQMVKYALESWGYAVIEAEDGNRLVEQAVHQRPNLILMDLTLPKLDGLTAISKLRAHESLLQIPFVIISGHAEPKVRIKAMKAGCSAYLTKPIDIHELEIIVNKLIPRA